MPHVRSVSIGVWLTRGSRHEATPARHRPFRRAHALQGHRPRGRPRTSRSRSTRSAASSTRSPRRNTPATTSRCSTSTCPWPSTSSPTSCCTRSSRPTTSRREKKVILEEIKMVEDTPDDLVHEIFAEQFWPGHPLGRPILGMPGRRSRRSIREGAAPLLRRRLRRPNFIVVGGRQSRARPAARRWSSEAFGGVPA